MIDSRSTPAKPSEMQHPSAHPMEIWISNVLRVGVLLSATVIAIGLLLLFTRGAATGTMTTLAQLQSQHGASISVSPADIGRGVRGLNPDAVIELGVLLLILTPITRVAMTAVLFALQRDHIFFLITSVVLIILLFGLVGFGS